MINRTSVCWVIVAVAVFGIARHCPAWNPLSLPAVFAQSSPKESVRAELIRLQTQNGLTLAAFYRGISYVDFTHRWESRTKESFAGDNGVELEGALTRDGNEVAFDLFLATTRANFLGIIRRGGAGFQEFPNVAAPYGMCWSYDESRLAISVQISVTQYKATHGNLILLNVGTKERDLISEDGQVTSQCWSPDGKNLVYQADGNIRLYNIEKREFRVLAKGKFPTWSSDGHWLAFLDNETYYEINPSGEERRVLFQEKKAFSGLWWSPDSNVVAYLSQNRAFERPFLLDVEPVRLRVRRLTDGSVDWVSQGSAAYLPSYQWVTNKDFTTKTQPSIQSK